MNIIGRITADANVKKLNDGRELVEFSVAVNRYYKPKGNEQGVATATYFNCSYWIGTKISERLKKGSLVELVGGLSVNAWSDSQGNPKASLNFHVDSITIHQTTKSAVPVSAPGAITEPVDDLPF
jgi:single-strand DNA-binding protein